MLGKILIYFFIFLIIRSWIGFFTGKKKSIKNGTRQAGRKSARDNSDAIDAEYKVLKDD